MPSTTWQMNVRNRHKSRQSLHRGMIRRVILSSPCFDRYLRMTSNPEVNLNEYMNSAKWLRSTPVWSTSELSCPVNFWVRQSLWRMLPTARNIWNYESMIDILPTVWIHSLTTTTSQHSKIILKQVNWKWVDGLFIRKTMSLWLVTLKSSTSVGSSRTLRVRIWSRVSKWKSNQIKSRNSSSWSKGQACLP